MSEARSSPAEKTLLDLPLPIETPPDLVALRRDLHRWPELRFQEHRTAAAVERHLAASRLSTRTGIAGTGVFASIDSGIPGPHVLIRADMDGMPIADLKQVSYASRVPGVAHACGHDVHTVVALGVADRFAMRAPPCGRVSFVFQPAEERPFGEPSGARAMLEDGLLAEAAPDAVLGLHCWPDLPVGTIGIDEHIAMAAKDAFRVRLRGKTAHAANPSFGRDAILGIAQVITALHQGFSRSRDAADLAILNVGTVSGGQSQSVIADSAEVTGTLRTTEPAVRKRLRTEIERIAQSAALMLDLRCEFSWADEMPAIINDPRLVLCARDASEELIGSGNTRMLTTPPMTTDDFALFAELMPALYLKLGVCGGDRCASLHNGAFDVDERSIGVGVAVLHLIALKLLTRTLSGWDQV